MKTRVVSALALLFIFVPAVLAQDAEPKVIKAGILDGKTTHRPAPQYPAEVKAAGIEGVVYVDVVIDGPTGNVISAAAATEPRLTRRAGIEGEIEVPVADERLRDAAEAAALEAKFAPMAHTGQPVRVLGTLVYHFVSRMPRTIAGGVLNGKAASLPRPAYPPAARAVRATGIVAVQILTDEAGNVISAVAVSGHPLLRAAAVEAAKAAIFSPTYLQGTPVTVSGVLTYNFVLDDEQD